MEKSRVLTLDSYSARARNDFEEPKILHLPIHIKVFKFINLGYLVFFNYSNILKFYYLVFVAKTMLAPPLPLQSSLLELSERLCSALLSSVLSTK